MSGLDEFELPRRKKPKVSELPLSSMQRASIDSMLHTFKKKGEFDAMRKRALQQYNESAQRGMFEASLRTFTASEIDRDPLKYLKPDRRIAAPLLEGAAARADVYGKTEEDINRYIDQYIADAERILREIRVQDIGEDVAHEEYEKGRKSDEAYATEAEERRRDRARQHVEDEKKRKKAEATERKKKELEALAKKQEQLQKEMERLQREAKRRQEREAFKAAEKEKERERIRKYNEEREKQRKEAEEREKAIQVERERRQKELSEMEQKRIEAEALDLLLKDARKMSEKGRRPGLERSESMEPPPSLMRHQSAPRNAYSKDQMRAQGLMPTSLTLRKGDKPLPPSSSVPPPPEPESRSRPSRLRSPSPPRSRYSGGRRDPSPVDRHARRDKDRDRRATLYRDISAEREAWKARLREEGSSTIERPRDRERERERGQDRPRERERGRGGEGSVVGERSARSKSRESHRPRRDESRGSRRNRRDYRSPSRSPRRQRERDHDRRGFSPRPRRDRSRSPTVMDRHKPSGAPTGDARVERSREGTSSDRRPRDGDLDIRGGDRVRDRERDRDIDRRNSRFDERERERDRERPRSRGGDRERHGSGIGGRPSERQPERSRSRIRDRERERERESARGGKDRARDRSREREQYKARERARTPVKGKNASLAYGDADTPEKARTAASKSSSVTESQADRPAGPDRESGASGVVAAEASKPAQSEAPTVAPAAVDVEMQN
ncbi:uncharacterized protein K489DRAFT_397310 [Dissoconium aciculare CBS 342.82]|uniref:BOD1/SHG1 domain-containing protein n=1 Tax=Dissoconium aciculare CBS 342.82 TaxID=1314786 RepID=A0A6J3MGF6_9PEZI|nr:uncharacterized protein K489DRAFT_397310 [Dissoconium aciculare CBS 342.82]KAF1826948.1 hypothetical protein K489DRAFT_397310 [Dissoconium aciculare CBS 342.82]